MPDENNNAAGADNQQTDNGAGENNGDTGADNANGVDNAGATDTGNDNAGAGEGQNNGDNGAGDNGDNNANGDDKNKKGDQNDDDGQEPEVRSRMSAKDFIIKRQQRKIANLEKKGNKNDDGNDDDSDDDDNDVAPEDEAMINKVVAKTFAPVIEKTLASEDDAEIQNFLKENPDFKPFEAKARRFLKHPSRRNLPVKSVFYEVAGDQLIKIGADREKKAAEKAKQTHTGGGSNRSGGEGGAKPTWDLSKDEFEAKQEKIRRGQS